MNMHQWFFFKVTKRRWSNKSWSFGCHHISSSLQFSIVGKLYHFGWRKKSTIINHLWSSSFSSQRDSKNNNNEQHYSKTSKYKFSHFFLFQSFSCIFISSSWVLCVSFLVIVVNISNITCIFNFRLLSVDNSNLFWSNFRHLTVI